MTKIERVIQTVDRLVFEKKIKSRKDLAEKIGYTESSLSQIINGKVSLSDKFIKNLSVFDSTIDYNWLMSGEGAMLRNDTDTLPAVSDEGYYVPLLPISAQGGSLNDYVVSVKDSECERIISPIKGADWAIDIAGDSMAPEYPAGSKILIKKVDHSLFLEWGKVYVLDTVNGVVIKELRPSEKEDCVRCISLNPDQDKYSPFQVNLANVYGIYRVVLLLSLK